MIEKLIQFSKELDFPDLQVQLEEIAESLNNENSQLVLPLIGEFSSGKTTIINSLSTAKALETASRPITATIYIIKFGQNESKAIIHHKNGSTEIIDDIKSIDNGLLKDVNVIEIQDTSNKVPEEIVLVDTPGLSSNEVQHRQNLVEFLPQADGVLLVVDINQSITRSLTEFAKTLEFSKRPLYLILTFCDLKSKEDIENQKKYIKDNTELHINGIACVSAKENDVEELLSLLQEIQKDKTEILKRVNDHRAREIAKEMERRINLMLHADENNDIDEEIEIQERKLRKLKGEIESSLDEAQSNIDEIGREISRKFEDEIFIKLETIISRKSSNYDYEALSAINNLSSIFLEEYKLKVVKSIRKYLAKNANKLDLSPYSLDNITSSYNINLNEAGHEYDKKIGTTLKIVAIAGAVIATAGTGAAAAGGAVAVEGGAGAAAAGMAAGGSLSGTATVMTTINAADTVSDIGSIISNRRTRKKLEKLRNYGDKVVKYGKSASEKSEKINELDQKIGQNVGQEKGLVQGFVGYFTEKAMGTPQRRRIISNFINDTLNPQFKSHLSLISNDIVSKVQELILLEAEDSMSALKGALEELKEAKTSYQNEYEQKINLLKNIKSEIRQL